MKKYIIPAVVVVAFGIYALLVSMKSQPVTTGTPTPIAQGTSSTPDITETSTPAGGSPKPTSTPATGTYKDGSYNGTVADAFFGKLQVTAVISGGKITNITFPVYPNESGHTQEVSSTDLPILKQEAIQSQSAKVNIVSGATQTSEAFQESLGAALAMAKN